MERFSGDEQGVFSPEEHLLVRFIQLLELFFIPTQVRMMDFGHFPVGGVYFYRMTFITKVLTLDTKELQAGLFLFR